MIYDDIIYDIINGNCRNTIRDVKQAISEKYPPENILNNALIPGINILSNRLNSEIINPPDIFTSSRCVLIGLYSLRPYLKQDVGPEFKDFKVLMGVPKGDIHDVGKEIVKTLIQSLGIEVLDLGIDVSSEVFIKNIRSFKPNAVFISTLLATTLPEIINIINNLQVNNLRDDLVIFIGGQPMSEEFRKRCRADYFIPDALDLRNFIRDNISLLKSNQTNKNII